MKKRLTIKDIANIAGTSVTTVSFYLNGKYENMSTDTREKIKNIIKKHKYQPNSMARGLIKKKMNIIGVLVGDITNNFSNQLVKGIEKNAEENGYEIIIGNSNYDPKKEESFINKLTNLGVAGFIIQPTNSFNTNADIIKTIKHKITFVDSQVEDNNGIASIKTDNYNSTYNCIKSIKEKEYYTKYIIIGGETSTLSTRIERTKGFFDAVDDKALQIVVSNYASEEEVREKLIKEIDVDEKTLIFVPNCWLLPTVYKVLAPYKTSIPNKIGLVGYDNLDWSEFVTPSVTTIVQPAFEEGYKSVDKLISQLKKYEEQNTINYDELREETIKENEYQQNLKTTLMCTINWLDTVQMDKNNNI